ncbi:MAG: isoleucine--tRNA ligase [bacterium]
MELNFPKIENKILKFWQSGNIFEKLRKKNQNKKRWSFLDGPITANNPMGVHHAWGRTYKDLFQRYKALQGFDQRFQNGFDCQGLWVEVEVEKELGFKTKKDIEKYGIAKFVEKCKERVRKYSKIQTSQSVRLGQWMDWQNSYYTMSDENNYAIWNFLKLAWQKGLLYKGRDSVPWCPRCGTAISQHEILTEDYQEITHDSIYLEYPIAGRKNEFLLVWTTTPWTLPGNVAVAIDPKKEYAAVSGSIPGNKYYVLKVFAESFNFKVIKTIKGKELVGLKYESPFDHLPRIKNSLGSYLHQVIAADPKILPVSDIEGTGLVHIAPGAGAEDFQLSKKLGIPIIELINEEARYIEGLGEFSGKNAKEHPEIIISYLKSKENGKYLFEIKPITHRYPVCWRCKSELVWRVVEEWYISMEKLRKPLMEVAKKITWIPSFGLDREIDWLKNMEDWLISKKRYWGLCLPIYECSCGNFEVIGSKQELRERAVSGFKEFQGHSPHRPWLDKVKIKCSKCGKSVSRILDVGNPWLDAGIVSFSTLHYSSRKPYWKLWFPADFICESFPGQFKNWFYSLIVMGTVLENRPPAKTIFGFASVRDEKGEEMHKSKGNAIWFDTAVEKIGAEPMRWMYSRQNPAANLKFGYKAAEEIKRKLLILWNSYLFFKTYVSDKESLGFASQLSSKPKSLLDQWIVSKLNNLIEKVTKNLDGYDPSSASLAIENFFVNDLSLWHIRRSRQRFQRPKSLKEKKEAGKTLYFVLLNLVRLISPMMPFLAEEIYLNLKTKNMPRSVHLLDWPKAEKRLINNELEEKMEKVREIVTLSLAERAKIGIKVRQPLAELRITNYELKKEKELLELVREEVNVKKISFGKSLKLDTRITAELKEEGAVREFIRNIQEMRKKAGLKPKDKVEVRYSAEADLNKILAKHKQFILKEANVKNLFSGERPKQVFRIEREVKVGQTKIWLAVKKI